MSYQLTKTNGDILTNLIDGKIDTFTTDIALIGRNVTDYGEYLNKNFIALLENFSNISPPSSPLEGQIWWNSSKKRIEVFNGTSWSVYGTARVYEEEPELVAGDLWLDLKTDQIKTSNGESTILVGPCYTKGQGKSGFVIETFRDILGNDRTVSSFYNAGKRVAILNNEEFFLDQNISIPGLASNVVPEGITPLGTTQTWFNGIADSAKSLQAGESLPPLEASQIMRKDADNVTTGSIVVNNNNGISIGLQESTASHKIEVSDSVYNYVISSNRASQNIVFRANSLHHGEVDAIKISPDSQGIALFGTDPQAALHVHGSTIIEDDFYLRGDSAVLDVEFLKSSAAKLELGVHSDGSFISSADQSGIYVQSDKSLTWSESTQSWKSSHDFDSQQGYKINGSLVVAKNSIHGITHAGDLQEIGKLNFLKVDDILIDESFVFSENDLELRSHGALKIDSSSISVGNANIEDVGDPIKDTDAVNKKYVDSSVQIHDIVMSFDITGLQQQSQSMEDAVASFLTDLVDPALSPDGRIAKIHGADHYVNAHSRKLIVYVCNNNAWVWQKTIDY